MTYHIETSNIVNKNIFETIQDLAICCICYGVVIDPLECKSCENCFCKKCIEKWNKINSTCPFKCSNYLLQEPTRVKKKILSRIIFLCPKNCNTQVKYDDILIHLNNCESHSVNCPTCGTNVSDQEVHRTSYYELKIENEILKKRVEDLERLNLNNGCALKMDDEDPTKRHIIKNRYSHNKEGNKIPVDTQKKESIKKFNKFSNKMSNNLYIHDAQSKYTYKFSCCNYDYDCVECHNEEEHHSFAIPSSITCQECLYISMNINDCACNNCGVSFVKNESSDLTIELMKSNKDAYERKKVKNLVGENNSQEKQEGGVINLNIKNTYNKPSSSYLVKYKKK